MSTDAVFARPSLIAAESGTKAYEGAGILDSACGMADGLKNGDWGTFGGNFAGGSLSALGAIMDPLQAVFAAGVGWLMEHVSILREPLDKLAGDPKAIEAHASSWQNVEQRIYAATDFFVAEVNRSTAEWASQAVAAYQRLARSHAESVQALGVAVDTIREVTICVGGLIGAFRNTIRDIVADVVGACISKAIQAFTVVLIPKVVAEIGLLVGRATRKIYRLLERLLMQLNQMGKLTGRLDGILQWIRRSGLKHGDKAVILSARSAEAAEAISNRSKHVFDTIGRGGEAMRRPIKQVAIDAALKGSQANAAQAGGETGDALHEKDPASGPIDLPL